MNRPPAPRRRRPTPSRHRIRSAALAVTALATLAAGAALPVTGVADPARAAGVSSSVTVPANVGEGSTFTVSKTTGLVDGEVITITGRIQEPAGDTPSSVGFAQTGTTYPSSVIQITDTPVVTGSSVADPEDGWSLVTAELTVRTAFTTPDDQGNPSVSFGDTDYDCLVQQCFLAVGNGHWSGGDEGLPFAVANLPWNVVNWVPISFAGGNADLTRDQAPVFAQQPSAVTVDQGGQAVFTASAIGLPEPGIRWQTSADDGASWSDVPDATDPSLTVTASATDDGRLYQAVASSRQGEIVSNTAALTVVPAPAQPGDELRDPLGTAGSWVQLSRSTDLADGQTISIEAEYAGVPEPVSGAVVVSQSGIPFDMFAMSRMVTESQAVWLDWEPLGNGRWRATGEYTVHSALQNDLEYEYEYQQEDNSTKPASFDCLSQQCYLEFGGQGYRTDGTFIQPGVADGDADLAHLMPVRSIYDPSNTVSIPLGFAGGSVEPAERSAPVITRQPVGVSVEENFGATFQTAATGYPAPSYSWQRSVDGGRTWTTIGGAASADYTAAASLDRNGSQYRARVANALGTVYTDAVVLTVTDAPDIAPVGVSLDWTGSAEMQAMSPARTANYFSAGSSDGTQAGYANVADDTVIVRRTAAGTEQAASYINRELHTKEGGTQVVRLQDGSAELDSDGAGTIRWESSWTVNFYGGYVPFTISDPVLTIDASGSGTLTADVAGYAASLDDPTVKTPLEPVQDVVVSTFSDARYADGTLTVQPDYAGVEVEVDAGHAPQLRTGAFWGSWPQSWVDFQFSTGLSSYWYSSGGSADAAKPASSFVVSGIELPDAPEPTATTEPTATPGPTETPGPTATPTPEPAGTAPSSAAPGSADPSGAAGGPEAGSSGSDGDLASTGAAPLAGILIALVLLAAGVGFVLRRRDRLHHG